LRAAISAVFARALDEALALIDARTPEPQTEWTSLKEAASRCDCHVETMASRAARHGLGHRINREWAIDMVRVRAWQKGQPYSPLPQDSPSSGQKCRKERNASDDTSPA
jgi:hypothetical protein